MRLATNEYEKFRVIQDRNFESDFEKEIKKIPKNKYMKKFIFAFLFSFLFVGMINATEPITFTVASYNLRYANSGDSLSGNGWGERCPYITKLIKFHGFDIFGTQEGFYSPLEQMKQMLPGYDYIGIGRDDGKKKGKHSAIFYNTEKLSY